MLSIDLHIHSINSGHAYGTVYEIINESLLKKMKLIAITDHGINMEGTSGPVHFHMGTRSPKKVEDLEILWGCEANLLNENGDIDLDPEAYDKLDVIILGVHSYTDYKDLGKEKNTKALIKAMERHPVNILAHPLNFICEYDTLEVWQCAAEQNILLELNLSKISNLMMKKTSKLKSMIQFIRDNNLKLIVNSDAHFIHEIGDDSLLLRYKDELGIEDPMIINNNLDHVKKWLDIN